MSGVMAINGTCPSFDEESLINNVEATDKKNGMLQRRDHLTRPERIVKEVSQIEECCDQNIARKKPPGEGNCRIKSEQFPKKCFDVWMVYCYVITFWALPPMLKFFGLRTRERQYAWREKMALITIITYLGLFIAFLTFGFTSTACKQDFIRINYNKVGNSSVILFGNIYDFSSVPVNSMKNGVAVNADSNHIFGPAKIGGMDISFLLQNVNGNCQDIILPKLNSQILHDKEGHLGRYFPCKVVNGSHIIGNKLDCNLLPSQRMPFYNLKTKSKVYYSWDQLKESQSNLVVYNGIILNLDFLKWLDEGQLHYPVIFDRFRNLNLRGYDISLLFTTKDDKKLARCLIDITRVGEIDDQTVGCIASNVVLYLSLIFILSIVFAKFILACYFRWFIAMKQGAFELDNKEWITHSNSIDNWSHNMSQQAPIRKVDPVLRPRAPNSMRHGSGTFGNIKRSSRIFNYELDPYILTKSDVKSDFENISNFNGLTTMPIQSLDDQLETIYPNVHNSNYNKSKLFYSSKKSNSNICSVDHISAKVHDNVIKQPKASFMPYNYPLIHTICFITCYSEDEEGLRITLDSISTTDYPNSHKLLVIVCDGLIKGSNNDCLTSDIILTMIEDFVIPPTNVESRSYISVASGFKRHNKAKVYAGFYKYNNETVPRDKQQRIPMILIVKCGNDEEQLTVKPGNRGKRDSQVILMSFLQKITFNERMTELEYQILKSVWQLTGLMADQYEAVLMVDADTKVYPDSITHMVAELVRDPSIMGLCGETKIANKNQSWVTAIQVFEYYISHHQVKAFESIFGSVTCLPGCFSIYRIKSPKGADGYWVPILTNPEIVEHYSDNNIKTLHKKNLLLLGEDRYLSSLMLKNFPTRKMIFVPKAACKTVVPSEFKILLSQRRRWINSAVHNLFELILVKDLCGTFCFSMQFVVIIELIGTLVLPLAICFTMYVIYFSIFFKPTPIITLILLAIILGLPGVLVIITTTKWSNFLWMWIYLLALPIWNLVLPSYAFWKFDDFSWGETRTIAGEETGSSHGDEEGIFDSSKIILRTWRDHDNRTGESNIAA